MATRGMAISQSRQKTGVDPSADPRPDLGLIDRSHVVVRARRRQARALIALAAACLALPLLLATLGHAVVASEQVRSDALQTEIAQALETQQQYQLQKSDLGASARIVTIAEARLHMVTPAVVTYLQPVKVGESVAQDHEPSRLTSAPHRASATGTKLPRRFRSRPVLGSTP
jgi:hypothetical protein